MDLLKLQKQQLMEADHLRMQSRKGKERLQTRARRRLHSPPPRFLAMEARGLEVGHRWPGCKQLWNRQIWWRPRRGQQCGHLNTSLLTFTDGSVPGSGTVVPNFSAAPKHLPLRSLLEIQTSRLIQ